MHIVHALIEFVAKGQALQATGQSHIVHAIVEVVAKGQALQATGQSHIVNALLKEDVDPKRISLKARILIGKGEVEKAKGLLRSYLKKNAEDSELRVLLAQVLFEQKDLEKAKAQYQLALELRPNDGALLLALAIISLEQENDAEAEKIFERMIRWSLRVDDAYYHLADITERKQDLAQALEYYKKLQNISKTASKA